MIGMTSQTSYYSIEIRNQLITGEIIFHKRGQRKLFFVSSSFRGGKVIYVKKVRRKGKGTIVFVSLSS